VGLHGANELELLAVIVFASVANLVVGQRIITDLRDETARADEPEHLLGPPRRGCHCRRAARAPEVQTVRARPWRFRRRSRGCPLTTVLGSSASTGGDRTSPTDAGPSRVTVRPEMHACLEADHRSAVALGRYRDRQRDRQTDRQTCIHTYIHKYRQTVREWMQREGRAPSIPPVLQDTSGPP